MYSYTLELHNIKPTILKCGKKPTAAIISPSRIFIHLRIYSQPSHIL